ncbi:Uncharacterised protein [Mycobacteroides abscessus subsp. massiliense]|nr:Uncharacterised protein [Mycobacteroides abscessus subsp. massiliense]
MPQTPTSKAEKVLLSKEENQDFEEKVLMLKIFRLKSLIIFMNEEA